MAHEKGPATWLGEASFDVFAVGRKADNPSGGFPVLVFEFCLERLDQGLGERRDIVRIAAGDDIAIDHHFFVSYPATGIGEIAAQARPACHSLPVDDVSFDEHPGCMADRGDGLALGVEVADQLHGLVVHPQAVWVDLPAR